jgi:hypothetical protein
MSASTYIGRTDLAGFDQDWVDATTIVDALAHEAIHHMIYMAEEAGLDLLTGEGWSHDGALQSPWTRKFLDIHTFVHACFVWYGLSRFWQQAICHGYPRGGPIADWREGGRRHLAAARSGFSDKFDAALKDCRGLVAEPILASLVGLRRTLARAELA